MNRNLFYIGITHKTAPLSIRERIRPDAERQKEMLLRLARLCEARMILMTCERFELYAHVDRVRIPEWLTALAGWFHVPTHMLSRYVQILKGDDVARHILRVAAGLESRIIGEAHILGQVRSAFAQAIECRALDAELAALGRSAIRTGKRTRHETAISKGVRSIATIAVDRALGESTHPDPMSCLVLGSGNLARDVVSDLSLRGARRIVIAGRNHERTRSLADRFDGRAADLDKLPTLIDSTDAVIVCTAAPTFLLDAASIVSDRTKPLSIIDLAVPRNVDPAVTRHPHVKLASLDELTSGRSAERAAIVAAERIVATEADAYRSWRLQRSAVPFITAIVRDADTAQARGLHVDRAALHRRILSLKAEAAA